MHVACTQNPNPCTTYMRTIKHEVHMPILIINIFIMGFTTIFPTIFFLFFNQNIRNFLNFFFSYYKFLYFFPSKFDIKSLKKKKPPRMGEIIRHNQSSKGENFPWAHMKKMNMDCNVIYWEWLIVWLRMPSP